MPDTPNRRPATRDELTQSLSFSLRFNGRKRVHDADETMARITAERLVEHLERLGYVVMQKPPLGENGTPGNAGGCKPNCSRPRAGRSAPVFLSLGPMRNVWGVEIP
jgi:hypothetical protein